MNGTPTAIPASGYGTSDSAIYLILGSIDQNYELLNAFSSGFQISNYESGPQYLTRFYQNLVNCLDAESIGVFLATISRNVTITEFRYFNDE